MEAAWCEAFTVPFSVAELDTAFKDAFREAEHCISICDTKHRSIGSYLRTHRSAHPTNITAKFQTHIAECNAITGPKRDS
eukprot:gene47460-biopygen29031